MVVLSGGNTRPPFGTRANEPMTRSATNTIGIARLSRLKAAAVEVPSANHVGLQGDQLFHGHLHLVCADGVEAIVDADIAAF